MSPVAYVFSLLCALAALTFAIELLRRGRMRERHAIWWISAGLLAVVIAAFPGILDWAAQIIGAEMPTNLVFFVSIAILFGVCLQLSGELTKHEEKLRALAERVAELQLRLDGPRRERSEDESRSE